jgi:hypothetical protein
MKCVYCGLDYNLNSIKFEQRVVDDRDFCSGCWDMIMSAAQDDEDDRMVLARSQ